MADSTATDCKQVVFSIRAAAGNEVYVAGSFNGWNAGENRLSFADGLYSTSLLLPPGRYEYKFSINGVWCIDPECRMFAPNGVGGLNSVVIVE